MIQCLHPNIIENICITCGHLISPALVSTYTAVSSAPPRLNHKYSISNIDFYLTTTIEKILGPIRKLEYTSEIKEILKSKPFAKISIIEKIAATAYYVLRRDNHPILLNDFTRISKRGKRGLLKHVCKEFTYIYNSDEYIKAVIARVKMHLSEYKCQVEVDSLFKKCIAFYEKYERCLVVVNVVLFLLFGDEYESCFYRYSLEELTDLKGIRKIKMKCDTEIITKVKKNLGLIKRIDDAYSRLYKKNTTELNDEIDLFIERLLLSGYGRDELKNKTMKEIRKMMEDHSTEKCEKSKCI